MEKSIHLILYQVEYRDSDWGLNSFLIAMDDFSGRRWTNRPDRLEEIDQGNRDGMNEIKIREIFDTHDICLAKLMIRDQWMRRAKCCIGLYKRTQHFGGHEEGGWYYYNQVIVDGRFETGKNHDLDHETDRYGEGYVEYYEPIPGYHENTHKPHYC